MVEKSENLMYVVPIDNSDLYAPMLRRFKSMAPTKEEGPLPALAIEYRLSYKAGSLQVR